MLDSSALITLAKADDLMLLALSAHEPVAVAGVYEETVTNGRYPHDFRIGQLFARQIVRTRDPSRPRQLPGISVTDSLVVLLAEEVGASELLSEDGKLLRRAQQRGVAAHVTAVFVQQLYETGKISLERRDGLFASFVANHRCTPAVVDVFLPKRKPAGQSG